MSQISRRQFLRMLAAEQWSAYPAAVPGCLRLETQQSYTLSHSCNYPPLTPPNHPPVLRLRRQLQPPLPLPCPLALRTWQSPAVATLKHIVRRALAAFGGMEMFVPKDARVIIKPNICVAYHTYEYAATTNPWVVGALVKTCLEAGARSVQVLDYPFGGTPQEAYTKSGIEEQVVAAGGEMVFMPEFKFVSADIPQGVDLKKTQAFGDVLQADVLIDVPIAKHHSLARLTLGMKNLMGIIKNRSVDPRQPGSAHRRSDQPLSSNADRHRRHAHLDG